MNDDLPGSESWRQDHLGESDDECGPGSLIRQYSKLTWFAIVGGGILLGLTASYFLLKK
jgi:hypothetical protein